MKNVSDICDFAVMTIRAVVFWSMAACIR